MGRNWVWDNREIARQRAQSIGRRYVTDAAYEQEVRHEMERRVAVWLATRHLTTNERPATLSSSLPSDERPSTSSCDETSPPAA